MGKCIESLKTDLNNIRSTRASASMLDSIKADYYGTPTAINQMASISVPESRVLLISPYDKSTLGEIEKAILKSDVGITPQSDGSSIRLLMPELSAERRRELVRQLKKRLEETRVALRNVRRDAKESMKKLEHISGDEIKSQQEQIQKLTDQYIKEAEGIASKKEAAITQI